MSQNQWRINIFSVPVTMAVFHNLVNIRVSSGDANQNKSVDIKICRRRRRCRCSLSFGVFCFLFFFFCFLVSSMFHNIFAIFVDAAARSFTAVTDFSYQNRQRCYSFFFSCMCVSLSLFVCVCFFFTIK